MPNHPLNLSSSLTKRYGGKVTGKHLGATSCNRFNDRKIQDLIAVRYQTIPNVWPRERRVRDPRSNSRDLRAWRLEELAPSGGVEEEVLNFDLSALIPRHGLNMSELATAKRYRRADIALS